MRNDNLSGQSRDEILEKILEETARNPYRPGSAKRRSSTPSRPAPTREPSASTSKSYQGTTQNKPMSPDITQVFSRAEAEEEAKQIENDIMSEKIEAMRQKKLTEQKYKNEELLKDDEPSVKVYQKPAPKQDDGLTAAEKIKKLHQEKAAAARAAIQQKADIENARRAQEEAGENAQESNEKGTGEQSPDEKVNLFIPDEDSDSEDTERGSEGILPEIFRIFHYCICICFILYMVFTLFFPFLNIAGESMSPTLSDGDKIIVNAVMYTPQRGDLVVIDDNTAALVDDSGKVTEKEGLSCRIVKRIIAVGGDTLDIDFEKGEVKVNGEVLQESYISEKTTRDSKAFTYPLTIPEGYVFVMGDNRNVSKDSRHPEVGLVPEKDIVGKAMLRVYPFGSIGTVN